MKKTIQSIFLFTLFGISTHLILQSSSNGRAFAANSGNTGAPSESTTCRSCHGSGFGTTVSISITDTSGNTVTEYIPGDTLDVEVEVKTTSGSPSRYGFQIVSLTSTNTSVSNWTSPSTNTRIATAGSREYAEHKGKSSTSTFSSKWVGPAKGTGSVTFYAGGTAVNNNGGTSGDGGNTTSVSLTEKVVASINENYANSSIKIFPNPAKDFITVSTTSFNNDPYEISIIDQKGQLVLQETMNNNKESLAVDHLTRGLYFIRINQATKSIQKKLLLN